MPHTNRVDPFGNLHATHARGTFMGNRGCLHDERGRIRRPFAHKAWVTCRLSWKGASRSVFTPGRYSELFFLDEATAMAAGHRPCNACRREAFLAFRSAWQPTEAGGPFVRAAIMDQQIHAERIAPDGAKKTFTAQLRTLPDGVMVVLPGDPAGPRLLWRGKLLTWSFEGYSDPAAVTPRMAADVLTPRSICDAIGRGYPVGVHPSAGP